MHYGTTEEAKEETPAEVQHHEEEVEENEGSYLLRRRQQNWVTRAIKVLLPFRRRDVAEGASVFSSEAPAAADVSDGGQAVSSSTVPSAAFARGRFLPRQFQSELMCWFLFLVFAYAAERCTFKLLLDRAGPFRLLVGEVIAGMQAFFLALLILIPALISRSLDFKAFSLPLLDLGLIAILDTIQLLLCVISGMHVPGVLTVILVHFTLPLTACFMQCSRDEGSCGNIFRVPDCDDDEDEDGNDSGGEVGALEDRPSDAERDVASVDADSPLCTVHQPSFSGLTLQHLVGIAIVTFAIALGMCPALLHLVSGASIVTEEEMTTRISWNTIVFLMAALPAAASTLLKEHALYSYRQPLDVNQVNLVLTGAQFVLVGVVSPLFYVLQGMGEGDGWVGMYPSRDISINFVDGLRCFVGMLDGRRAESGYAEAAQCGIGTGSLLLGHVVSLVAIGLTVNHVVIRGTARCVYKGIGAGVILAFGILYVYDERGDQYDSGPAVRSFLLSSFVVLIIGLEVYHRPDFPGETFETIYPDVDNMDDDE